MDDPQGTRRAAGSAERAGERGCLHGPNLAPADVNVLTAMSDLVKHVAKMQNPPAGCAAVRYIAREAGIARPEADGA